MLIRLFFALRAAGLLTSVTELLDALWAGYARASLEEFYALARMALVKGMSPHEIAVPGGSIERQAPRSTSTSTTASTSAGPCLRRVRHAVGPIGP